MEIKIDEGVQRFWAPLITRLAPVTDGHVILILLLQMQTRRQLTPATKRQILHGYRNLKPTTKFVAYLLIQSAYITYI